MAHDKARLGSVLSWSVLRFFKYIAKEEIEIPFQNRQKMADIADYTQSFKIQGLHAPRKSDVRSARKRNRQPVSCRPCRSRRSKCDRSHPCSTCRARGEESNCFYADAGAKKPVPGHGIRAQKVGLQDRLQQLESLVSHMMSTSRDGVPNHPSPSGPKYQSKKESGDPLNRLKSNELNGVGRSQWSVILDEIGELRSTGDLGDYSSNTNIGSDKKLDHDTLIGASRPASVGEVLQRYLPPKLQVDRLLSTYFKATYVVIPIIHSSQFQRQYEAFWWNPCEVDPVWVATLFAILCISASINFAERSEPDLTHRNNFLTATSQCLVLGGYTIPELKVVQALLLFAQCKHMASVDPPREIALVLALVIRLAFQIGLHREPHSSLSVFEGEMRRRLWIMCRCFDLVVSYPIGLPSNVPHDWHDTKLPRNLLDDDFDEASPELPPSRSEAEVTPMLYFVVKARVMTAFGKIYHQALSLQGIRPQDVVVLEAENQKEYDLIPPPLRIRPMSQSFTSSSHHIMGRLNLEFLYQRSICLLHRQGLVRGDLFSRSACLRAAMAMISHLADLHKEFIPTGQLPGARWMLSSTIMSDFLLATVILCLVLSKAREAHDRGLGTFDPDEWAEPIEALKKAQTICVNEKASSQSAARVEKAASFVLLRLDLNFHQETQSGLEKSAIESGPATVDINQTTLQPLTPASQQADGATLNPGYTEEFGLTFDFKDMLDDPDRLGWTAIDQYLNFAGSSE